jgi:hypothetical protein
MIANRGAHRARGWFLGDKEIAMRSFHYPVILAVAAGLFAAITISTPATATNISQARQLCAKNPDCNEIQEGTFCVNHTRPHRTDVCLPASDEVNCPTTGGDCHVVPKKEVKHVGNKSVVKALTAGTTLTTKKPPSVLDGGLLDNRPGLSSRGPGGDGQAGRA